MFRPHIFLEKFSYPVLPLGQEAALTSKYQEIFAKITIAELALSKESPSLEAFKRCAEAAFRGVV